MGDVRVRDHWDAYMQAYEDTIRNTASEHAPWYVVPADHKWFTLLVVAAAVIDALQSLKLEFPKLDERQTAVLQEARRALERDGKVKAGGRKPAEP